MHAAVNHIQIQRGKMSETINIFRDSVVPAFRQQQGSNGAILLTDANTDKAIAIAFWESEADAAAVITSKWYQGQVAKLTGVIAEPPVRDVYEIIAQENKGESTNAQVNYRQVPPERMDEAIRTYLDSTLPAVREARGFKGALILADRNASKMIAIALFETAADISARAPTPFVDSVTGGPPVREVYQVSVEV